MAEALREQPQEFWLIRLHGDEGYNSSEEGIALLTTDIDRLDGIVALVHQDGKEDRHLLEFGNGRVVSVDRPLNGDNILGVYHFEGHWVQGEPD